MQDSIRGSKQGSFIVAVVFTFMAAFFNIVGFVSPNWIVSLDDSNLGFVRLGLWGVCFENFIFPEDYVSKAYQGCWYIYYPEYKYIRYWLNPPWFFAVQMLSIISLICNLTSLLYVIMILCEVYENKERKPQLIVTALQSVACCFVIVTILMGVMSKDREWLPRPDRNMLSWSFAFAVLAGFFTVFCLFGLITHNLSIESKRIMQDPSLRQKLIGDESTMGFQKSVSYFETGAGTESKLGAGTVPSLFTTVPSTFAGYPPGSHLGPTSTLLAPGNTSGLSRGTIAPGAVGAAAAGTSAANVSAKLRDTLEAQRAAILEANIRAAEVRQPDIENPYSISSPPKYGSSLPRHTGLRGSASHLQSNIAMDSAV